MSERTDRQMDGRAGRDVIKHKTIICRAALHSNRFWNENVDECVDI